MKSYNLNDAVFFNLEIPGNRTYTLITSLKLFLFSKILSEIFCIDFDEGIKDKRLALEIDNTCSVFLFRSILIISRAIILILKLKRQLSINLSFSYVSTLAS